MEENSKLALITGASSGIGAATARLFAANGHRVVLVGRRREALDAVAADIGISAIVEPCDASDGDAVLAMADRVRREHRLRRDPRSSRPPATTTIDLSVSHAGLLLAVPAVPLGDAHAVKGDWLQGPRLTRQIQIGSNQVRLPTLR